jgi:ankyrin repeat protein
LVQLLLKDSRIDINKASKNGETPFMLACYNAHDSIVEEFLKDRRITDEDLNKLNKSGESSFFYACAQGFDRLVQELIKDRRIDIHKVNQKNETPFLIACINGRDEVVEVLLKDDRVTKEYLNKKNNFGQSPFALACSSRHLGVVQRLLKDDRIDLHETDEDGNTPFSLACLNGRDQSVEALLKNERIKKKYLNKKNNFGQSPFFLACSMGHLSVVQQLLKDDRIDLHATDEDGNTPFMLACFNGLNKVVEVLLKDRRFDQDLNRVNNQGDSPFKLACEKAHPEVVKLLFSAGQMKIELNSDLYKEVFYNACYEENLEIMKVLVEEVPPQLPQPPYFVSDEIWFKSCFRQLLLSKKSEAAQYLISIGIRFALEEFFGGDWSISDPNNDEEYKMLKDIIYASFEAVRVNVTLLDRNELYQNRTGLFNIISQNEKARKILVGAGLKGEFYLKKAAEQLLLPACRGNQKRIKRNLKLLREEAVLYAEPSVRQELTSFVYAAGIAFAGGHLEVKNENEMIGPSTSIQDGEDLKNAARFFTILKAVPTEIQEILAHRVVNSPKDFVHVADQISGIKELLKPYQR